MLSPTALTVEGLFGEARRTARPNEAVCQILQVKTSHEKLMGWRLLAAGVDYVLPINREMRRNGDRWRVREIPATPGYIFLCNPDRHAAREKIEELHTASVLRFIDVPRGEEPRLIAELAELHFSMVQKMTRRPDHGYRSGDKCKVIAGAFVGHEGEIDCDGKRGWVFLKISYLGQIIPLEIPVDHLERV